MNITASKQAIIDEIIRTDDVWLLHAIRRLLDIDYEDDGYVSEGHKRILEERRAEMEANPGDVIDWETAKKNILSA